MNSRLENTRNYALAVIALVSCAMLMYEILLTRICALRLLFHFSFLVVSNCLLGIGASGSLIAILDGWWQRRERLLIWLSTLLFLASLFVVYAFLRLYEIPPGVSLSSLEGLWRFSVFNLVAAVPFFFAGATVGMILTAGASRVHRVYFYDLLGAGIGCLACPALLWQTGAGGCLIAIALLLVVAAILAAPARFRRIVAIAGVIAGGLGLWLLPSFDALFPVPSKTAIQLTKDKEIDLSALTPYSRWSAISRVDLYPVDKSESYIFGRGRNAMALPLPEQRFILQDGSAGTYILNYSGEPEGLEILARSSYSAAVRAKEQPRVFIIGVGGGNDVWAAWNQDASFIKGIELNRQILDIHYEVLPDFSRKLIEDPRIELVRGEGRSALMREQEFYDIVQLTGIDTWTSLASGAYMLAENYVYTVEAVEHMYDRLLPGGIIQITRFGHPMETMRLLANVHAAFENRGDETLEDSLVVFMTPPLVTVLARSEPFPPAELARLDRFFSEAGIEPLYHPRQRRGNAIEHFIRSDDRARIIAESERDISPTTDNRPYFFNFTRWNKLFSAAKFLDEPSHVSQGNPLFILGQLGLSALLSLLLIMLPILAFRKKGLSTTHLPRFLLYFAGLGLGFIIIEIVLMQKLVLFVGHPLYSITVTLFTMLLFTGIGSLLSERWFLPLLKRSWLVPTAMAVLLGALILLTPLLVTSAIGLPDWARFLLAGLVLAPVSLVLGIPFAFGIKLLGQINPSIIPWAWAVNGCATVCGAILAVMLSMNIGFNLTLIVAVVIYFIGFDAIRKIRPA